MMKGRETFYSDHTVPITSCSEVLLTISAFSVLFFFFFQNGCMLTLSDLDQRQCELLIKAVLFLKFRHCSIAPLKNHADSLRSLHSALLL